MVSKNKKLIVELVLLFVALPFTFLLPVSVIYISLLVVTALIYVTVVIVKNKLVNKKSLFQWSEKSYWKYVLLRFAILALISVMLIYLFMPEKLFLVVKKNFLFWLMLSAFYSVFSVYPQEFLYRSFFFARYKPLVKNKYLFIGINAVVFSLAHVGFKNFFVLLITFLGGIVFALTFYRTKSLLFTSVEHAIYGVWIFTVGAGEMLAFPMPG